MQFWQNHLFKEKLAWNAVHSKNSSGFVVYVVLKLNRNKNAFK